MEDVINIQIRKFDPDRMKEDKIILIIGPQYSGKTHLNRDLLYYINTPFGLLVDPTESLKGTYGQILPKQCRLGEINKDILVKLCNRQLTLADFNKKYGRNLDSKACLIMDNCVGDLIDMKWNRNENFKWIFRTGKDASLSMIITSPYPLKMPEHYSSSVDYVFILQETNKKHKKAIFDMFGGMFESLDKFTDVMDACTEDYGCMVIDRTIVSNRLDDQVSWYKSDSGLKRHHMGSKRLWEICLGSSVTLDELLMEPLKMFETKSRRR